MHINIGDIAKDTVTGFKGVVIGRTEWLNGCARLGLQSQTLKDGAPVEAQWFDENQCQIVKVGAYRTVTRDTGGPRANPMRAKDPSR